MVGEPSVVESDAGGVGAVVLAAGSSSRMGVPKQTLQFRGQSMLRRAVLAALGAGCRPVVVVTGAHAEQSRGELRGLDVVEAVNDSWETGMASSVRAGVGGLVGADPEAAAAVLMLCDQPHVTAEVIGGLVAAYRATGSAVVASVYGGGFGVPALFGRALFAELARLEGAAGAKQVIKRHAAEALLLPFPGGEVDVDTPDDFSRLITEKDEGGTVHSCSAVCTHMGCLVHWNSAERSRDCPCHGSRFDHDGKVIQGPANEDLEPGEL